jgi:NTE family protein
MKVGLVLGGGGLAGATFHAAALAALEIDLGWDARRADVILGTSSGALTGALLTLGVTGADLAAFISGAPLPADHFLVRRGAELPDLPAVTWRHFMPRPRTQDLRRLARAFQSPGAAILGMLPHGTVDLEHHIGFLEAEAWPASDLRICAVRQDDHELVVWDGAGPASLAVAVAASSTIPGYARPIRVGDHDYVDGGLRSPTNADTLLDDGLDVALILSPMTPDSGSSIGIRGALNMWASRRLRREVTALRQAGTEVIVLRSPTELGRAATSPFVSLRKRPKGSVAEALISVGDQTPRLRALLGQRT